MKILVSYRGIPQSPGWATGDSVVRAFRALGHEVKTWGHFYQDQCRKLRDQGAFEEYDLHVYMEMNDPDPQYPVLRNLPAKKRVAWMFDVGMNPMGYKGLCDYMEFDHVFCGNPSFVEGFFDQPSSFLPYAADLDLHYRPLTFKKTYVATLVGSDRESRRQLIEQVRAADAPGELITDVFRKQYIDTLAGSMISICDIAGGGEGLMPMRFFEAPAAGSLLVCQLSEDENPDSILREGEHYIGFQQPEELPGLIKFLMENVDDREEIWQNGHEHVLSKHTYRERCQEILRVAGF